MREQGEDHRCRNWTGDVWTPYTPIFNNDDNH